MLVLRGSVYSDGLYGGHGAGAGGGMVWCGKNTKCVTYL